MTIRESPDFAVNADNSYAAKLGYAILLRPETKTCNGLGSCNELGFARFI